MELTENAVARPDELVVYSDFESRPDWYRDWLKANRPQGELGDWEPKRRGFVGIWFIYKNSNGQLQVNAELAPPDEIIEHCRKIRAFWLEKGGYFKWMPALEKQFARAGVKVEIPESLTEERSWRLAENDSPYDRYEHEQPDTLQRVSGQERQDSRKADC